MQNLARRKSSLEIMLQSPSWTVSLFFWLKIFDLGPRILCCVHVVLDYSNIVSAYSTTTPTTCPHIQRLRRHHVRVVNNYFSMCPRSQLLCQNGVSVVNDYADMQFLKISFYIFLNFFVSILLFPK